MGGQSADGGGDGESVGEALKTVWVVGSVRGVAVSPTFEACYFFLTKTDPSGFHWRRPSRGRRIYIYIYVYIYIHIYLFVGLFI